MKSTKFRVCEMRWDVNELFCNSSKWIVQNEIFIFCDEPFSRWFTLLTGKYRIWLLDLLDNNNINNNNNNNNNSNNKKSLSLSRKSPYSSLHPNRAHAFDWNFANTHIVATSFSSLHIFLFPLSNQFLRIDNIFTSKTLKRNVFKHFDVNSTSFVNHFLCVDDSSFHLQPTNENEYRQ